jgi:pimeloyl-ACP methyl ester carboxylesterase
MVTVRAPERATARQQREQSRARYPDATGSVERDQGWIAWEAYGSGDPPIVFVPPWQIVHSRVWKAQIPYFARRHRVVAWDNRGSGRSDRPTDPAVHAAAERARNLGAVMDAAGLGAAVLVGLSSSAAPMVAFTASHPERVTGLVFVCPATPLGEQSHSHSAPFEEVLDSDSGWSKENVHYWRRDYAGYLEYFFGEAFPEPHSTKQVEDAVGYGLDTDWETLAVTKRAPASMDLATYRARCASFRQPTLIIQGTDERISHLTQAIGLAAAIPGARLELIDGAGHIVNARDPVRVNLLIRDFLRTLHGGSDDARARA